MVKVKNQFFSLSIISKKNIHRILTILFIFFSLLAIGSFGFYQYRINKTINITKAQLASSINDRSSKALKYVQTQIDDASLISRNKELLKFFKELIHEKNEQNKDELNKKITLVLELVATEDSFQNSIFVNKNGTVLFSDYALEYVGKNIAYYDEKASALSQSFMRALMGLSIDLSEFAYDPILKRPALFVTLPLFEEKELIGIFIQEINPRKLYTITHDYLNLGETGDILCGTQLKDGIMVINSGRIEDNKPFKYFIANKYIGSDDDVIPLKRGIEGSVDSGVTTDLHGNKVIASWGFIPQLEWGISAQIQYKEATAKSEIYLKLCYVLLIMSILLFALGILFFSWLSKIKNILLPRVKQNTFNCILAWSWIIIIALFLAKHAYTFYHVSHQKLIRTKEKTVEQVDLTAEKIQGFLEDAEHVGMQLSNDLTNQTQSKESLVARIENDVKANPSIYGISVGYTPYSYGPEKRLYAPYVRRVRTGLETLYQEETYDYTLQETNFLAPVNWDWYNDPLKQKKKTWLSPFRDPHTGDLIGAYGIPFYDPKEKNDKKIIGIVFVMVILESLKKMVSDLAPGQFGYAFLVDPNGYYLAHPINDYIVKRKTIYDIASEDGNESLAMILKDIFSGKSQFNNYIDSDSGELTWVYSKQIPGPLYVLNAAFIDRESRLTNKEKLRYCMELILLLLILLISVFLFFTHKQLLSNGLLAHWLACIVACCFILLVISIWLIPVYTINHGMVMGDTSRINKFIEERTINAHVIHEPAPTPIRLGLRVSTLSFPNKTTLAIAGELWQKVADKKDMDLLKEIRFPDQIESPKFEKVYEHEENDGYIKGWQFNAKLAHKLDYKYYPLDAVKVVITMEHADRSKETLIVPDLDSYSDTLPSKLPGLGENLSLAGYTMQNASFVFKKDHFLTNYGLESFANTQDHVHLQYEIQMQRNILFDFFVYILPLLIVFFAIYALYVMDAQEKLQRLSLVGSSIGLIFVITLLHGTFRSQFAGGDILYLEYLFFLNYFSYAVLVVYTLVKPYKGKLSWLIHTSFALYRHFFWAIQLALLFAITMVIFYG